MPLRINPEALDASGRQLQDVADRFAQALTAFQAELQSYGQPWGSDDIGSLIGAAHDEVSQYAFECYQEALDEIGAAGGDVGLMGRAHSETDQAGLEKFTTMQHSLGY